MKKAIHDRCPHLGLEDDSETALGYPSEWNRCHNVKLTVAPSLEHQREVCLGADYLACPVFGKSDAKKLPQKIRLSPRRRPLGRTALRIGIASAITLLLVGSSLILSGYWALSWMPGGIASILTGPIVSSTALVKMPPEALGTDTPEHEQGTDVLAPATMTMIVPTQTEIVRLGACAYSLETPIGTTQPLVLHKVAIGESMTILAEDYETTIEAIDKVNYFLPSPLWSEFIVIIPSRTNSPDTLSPLKPVFVQYDHISVEELAENLSVSLPDLMEINALDPACESFSGWILIPAGKISLSQ